MKGQARLTHFWLLPLLDIVLVEMVEEDGKRHGRVRVEALQRIVGQVVQHLQEVSFNLVEPSHHAIVHPKVGAVSEGVAVLLADGHAWIGRPHMGKHQGGHDLGAEPREVFVVPGRRDAGEDARVWVDGTLLFVRIPECGSESERERGVGVSMC